MDMNLGQLARFGFIERKGEFISEGPLLDLLMDTDTLKDRIINGALADIFHVPVPRTAAAIAAPAPVPTPASEPASQSASQPSSAADE